jgi:quercetin dioxygenase-like cupin family protein
MKHIHYTDVAAESVEVEGAKDVKIRWLITKDDGAKHFAMRLFEVQPGGCTPFHQHDWEHEVFIVAGFGEIRKKQGNESFKQGDVIFVAPEELHQFVNTGEELLQLICLIPY